MTDTSLNTSLAAKLSNQFQLQQIICLGLEARSLAGNVSGSTDLSWDMPKTRMVWDLEDDALRVVAPMSVFVETVADADRPKVRLAEFTIAMRVDYSIKRDIELDEQDIPHYVGICSFLHLWPYLRAEVQSLTTKLGFPPLLLPVIVSGQAAKRVIVTRLNDATDEPAAPAKKATGSKKTTEPKKARKLKT